MGVNSMPNRSKEAPFNMWDSNCGTAVFFSSPSNT